MKLSIAIDILRLLYRDESGIPIPVSKIALRFGVTPRTIYRYLDELTCCGIPIDRVRGYGGGIGIKLYRAGRTQKPKLQVKEPQVIGDIPNQFKLLVTSNGLEKAGIKGGEFVTCESADTARDGDIVFASVLKDRKEQYSLSRYREVDGEIRLCSETDRPSYYPYVTVSRSDLKIYGRVVGHGGD